MTEIQLRDVSYSYSVGTPFEKKALDQVNMTIEGGIITGLIGHTGSGKSTLVQLLNGLLTPSEGQVLLNGTDIWADPKKIRDVRFRVGLVFQYPEYQLFEETVYKDIAFGPTNMGLDQDEIVRRVREAMEFVELPLEMADKSPFELSGGQKRRVAIAGVLAMGPEVLILDEPAAGLDPRGRNEILGGLHHYQREKKNTMIIVSHSMEDMAKYSDKLFVMSDGKVLLSGEKEAVFAESELLSSVGLDVPQITRFVAALRKHGVDIPADIYSVEQARDAILRLRERRGERA